MNEQELRVLVRRAIAEHEGVSAERPGQPRLVAVE